MTIDWNHFTPWASLAGGILLGLASAMFILVNGRILGISGIVGGLLRPRAGDIGWRLAFVLGMLVAPSLYVAFIGPMVATIDASWAMVIVAGLLVGIGTRYGSGCTSVRIKSRNTTGFEFQSWTGGSPAPCDCIHWIAIGQ